MAAVTDFIVAAGLLDGDLAVLDKDLLVVQTYRKGTCAGFKSKWLLWVSYRQLPFIFYAYVVSEVYG